MSSSVFMQCGSGTLDNAEVERLLGEKKIYPLTLEYRVYANSEEEAKKVHDAGLDSAGWVTVQLKHTVADVGTPLVHFTEKSSSYLITTSDTLKSLDIQKVRIADEIFTRVNKIEINPAGNKAVVDYTVRLENLSPFIVLSTQDSQGDQPRRTFFTKEGSGWKWDGKIIRMPGNQ